MPSIIEQITAAEQEAQQLKKDTAAKGRELVAKKQAECAIRLETAREAARAELYKAEENAEKEGAKLAEDIERENAQKTAELCAAARENIGKAVSHIIERVVKA